jgi:hypothetical protein
VKEGSIVVQARVWTPSFTPKHSFLAENFKEAEKEYLYYAGSRGLEPLRPCQHGRMGTEQHYRADSQDKKQ